VENLDVPHEAATLHRHLVERRRIEGIEDYDPELLSVRSEEVREHIRSGGDWESLIDPETIDLIKRNGLFGCPLA
jgi:hypothetical protein